MLDSVQTEIRQIREEYARKFQGNVRAMMDDLRRRHAESDRKSVSQPLKPRRKIEQTDTPST